MKDFFKPEDFTLWMSGVSYDEKQKLADQANFKLNKLIESWPVVYGEDVVDDRSIREQTWYKWAPDVVDQESKYKARLAFIEEIKKEPCKHEPDIIDARGLGYLSIGTLKCKHCGVELVADWRAK